MQPGFREANHASGYDSGSRHRQVGISGAGGGLSATFAPVFRRPHFSSFMTLMTFLLLIDVTRARERP
jgi:hypothetical protein